MKRSASFFIGFIMMAVVFLSLPSFSYAQKSVNQVTVSATVLEHLTYNESNGHIFSETNLKAETIITSQEGIQYVTLKI